MTMLVAAPRRGAPSGSRALVVQNKLRSRRHWPEDPAVRAVPGAARLVERPPPRCGLTRRKLTHRLPHRDRPRSAPGAPGIMKTLKLNTEPDRGQRIGCPVYREIGGEDTARLL